MKHLIITTEYPPTQHPAGGIGTYVKHIANLLAQNGESVHIITPLWGAAKTIEEEFSGRLVIHRLPAPDDAIRTGDHPYAGPQIAEAALLARANLGLQAYSMRAGRLAEYLIEHEGIDIIEAQEYDAPLYDLQLRRALGMGPKRQPPCIVHLHSPTEFIAHHNDWELGRRAVMIASRLEEYCISAADALLCPSRYLAHQVEHRYGLADGSIRVIPYPIGTGSVIPREVSVWRKGTICYVGRLERRKGILEWIDAAVSVAKDRPDLLFDFIGANILGTETASGDNIILERIPLTLRSQFRCHGQQSRADLARLLAQARIAVVPSRWENFPNTCIEAMASGLPVIVSRDGGMAEMVRDESTGWIADSPGTGGLAGALHRAIRTTPERLADMGRRASEEIRALCDNAHILEAHLAFRRGLVRTGSSRSLHLPMNFRTAQQRSSDKQIHQQLEQPREEGIALVILQPSDGSSLKSCLASIERQTKKPTAVYVVETGAGDTRLPVDRTDEVKQGWQVMRYRGRNRAAAKNRACEAIFEPGAHPIGFAFVQYNEVLDPEFVSSCESVLRSHPHVGLVSGWILKGNSVAAPPCPGFPWQWLVNDVAACSAIRTQALTQAGNFRAELDDGYDDWDLANAVMAGGWTAVTFPGVLASTSAHPRTAPMLSSTRQLRQLLERFPDLVARDAMDLLLLSHHDRRTASDDSTTTPMRLHRRVLRKFRYYLITFVKRENIRSLFPSTPPWRKRHNQTE